MKVILAILLLATALSPAFVSTVQAKGSSSSGRSSSSSYRSSSRSSSKPAPASRPKPTSSRTSPPASKPVPSGKSKATPGSTVKTSSGATVKTSAKKPSNTKYSRSKGVVGDNGYQPTFNSGYQAPAGSVIYYPQHDVFDYLPWVYLFSQTSPRNDAATVVQPDGKEVKAQPVKEGTDGLVWLNWVVMLLLGLGLIAGVTYGVYRWTNRNQTL